MCSTDSLYVCSFPWQPVCSQQPEPPLHRKLRVLGSLSSLARTCKVTSQVFKHKHIVPATLHLFFLCHLMHCSGFLGSERSPQQRMGFDFSTLARAAGQGLPQMPPMPKGVTTLEDLERQGRIAGQTPPPGFARPSCSMDIHPYVAETPQGSQLTPADSAPAPSQPQPLQATPGSTTPLDPNSCQDCAAPDSGKTLLSLLSNGGPALAATDLPRSTAITPPPGFAAIPKPQLHTPIPWGTSPQLQDIWGAPGPSISGSQPTWGAPVSSALPGNPTTGRQASFAEPSQRGGAEQSDARQQSQAAFSSFAQVRRSPSAGLSEMPASANSDRGTAFGLLGYDRRSSSGAMQPDLESPISHLSSHHGHHGPHDVSNPLLAMLGQHRPSPGSYLRLHTVDDRIQCHTSCTIPKYDQLLLFSIVSILTRGCKWTLHVKHSFASCLAVKLCVCVTTYHDDNQLVPYLANSLERLHNLTVFASSFHGYALQNGLLGSVPG